jgi:carbamoyl-phosphate synthase large subunit
MASHSNILISSAGRRVGLLACFREALARRGRRAEVLTIDCGTSAPATIVSTQTWRVPRSTDPAFVDAVLGICARHEIGLLVPTIDTELPAYSAATRRFEGIGVAVGISSPQAIRICCNKVATHEWLVEHDFPHVRQTDVRTALAQPADWLLPLIAKPYDGSASIGLRRIATRLELETLAETGDRYIVQEIARGREFTINVYVSRAGECVCAVPHWRMEVRAGEVSKGITVKDRRLMELGRAVAEALPGADRKTHV